MTPSRPLAALAALLAAAAAAPAQSTYTWTGPTAGSTFWGTSGFWSGGVIPGTADTAVIPSVAADRSIEIKANSPPAGVGTLRIQQTTAGVLNQLVLRKSWTVANPTTLGAAAGTAELRWLNPGDSNSYTLSYPNGLTVAAGGRLSSASPSASGQQTLLLAGPLAQTGGEIAIDAPAAGLAFSGLTTSQTSTFALSGGTVTISGGATFGGFFSLSNTLTATGGTIQMGPNAQLTLQGATSSIGGGVTFQNVGGGGPTNGTLRLARDGTQALTADTPLPAVVLVADQTSAKTVGRTTSTDTLTVQSLTFQGGPAGQTLSLSSNIATATTTGSPLGSTGSGSRTVNLFGSTLDLRSTGTTWAPTGSGWTLDGAPGSAVGGRVRAAGFDFSGPTGGVAVRANVVLEATGGDGAVLNLTNNLGGVVVYDPTSTVSFTGPASAGNPAVLATNRTLGRLAVTNPFGQNTLRVDTPATLAGDLRIDTRLQLNGVVMTLGGTANLTTVGTAAVLAGAGPSAQLVFGSGATGGISLTGVTAPLGALTLSGTFASTALSLADTSTSRFDIAVPASDRVNLAGNGVRYGGTLALTLTGTLGTTGPTDFPLFQNVGAATSDFTAISLTGGNSALFSPTFNPASGVLTLTPVPEPGLLGLAAAAALVARRRWRS